MNIKEKLEELNVGQITGLQPGDTLLLRYNERALTQPEAEDIKERVRQALGDSIKFLVVGANFEPYVLRNEDQS